MACCRCTSIGKHVNWKSLPEKSACTSVWFVMDQRETKYIFLVSVCKWQQKRQLVLLSVHFSMFGKGLDRYCCSNIVFQVLQPLQILNSQQKPSYLTNAVLILYSNAEFLRCLMCKFLCLYIYYSTINQIISAMRKGLCGEAVLWTLLSFRPGFLVFVISRFLKKQAVSSAD